MKEKIVELENRNLIVYLEPSKLREMADRLELRQRREDLFRRACDNPDPSIPTHDLLHCELHDGPISIWFRLPSGYPS